MATSTFMSHVRLAAERLAFATDDVVLCEEPCIRTQRAAGDSGVQPNAKAAEACGTPGTADFRGARVEGTPWVCVLRSQYAPGRPGEYLVTGTGASGVDDSANARLEYFRRALAALPLEHVSTVGIPYYIGCGANGGQFGRYFNVINAFAREHPDVLLTMYK